MTTIACFALVLIVLIGWSSTDTSINNMYADTTINNMYADTSINMYADTGVLDVDG